MRSIILGSAGGGILLLAACASQAVAPVVASHAPATVPASVPTVSKPAPELAPSPEVGAAGESAVAVTVPDPAVASRSASLKDYLDLLRRASCPSAIRRQLPEVIPLKAAPVPLQTLNPTRKKVGDLNFVAGFHLTSSDERFGGLSGLDVLDDGNLLAVSDLGDFVWIDLGKDSATPVAARIAGMRDEGGEFMRAKAEGDAEGLAVNDGLALVSFERNHRVLAFDLAACGGAARGAPITLGGHSAPLSQAFAVSGINVGGNSGAEPLGVTRDWYLLAGLETKAGEASPLSARPLEAQPKFDIRLGAGLPEFVGLDVIETGVDGEIVRVFSLHRSRNALSSSVIAVAETQLQRASAPFGSRGAPDLEARSHERFTVAGSRQLASMSLLLTIDNFEGMAAREMPNGDIRLYVISDNNFSADQRTLLMVFDLKRNAE